MGLFAASDQTGSVSNLALTERRGFSYIGASLLWHSVGRHQNPNRVHTGVSKAFPYLVLCLALAGWSCVGVSEEVRQQSQANVNLARGLYADEHNVRGAIEACETAVRLDPTSAEAHLLLGQMYGAEGDYARAEPHLRRAVALFLEDTNPIESTRRSLAEARNALAACLINLTRYDEAIELLGHVLDEVLYARPYLAYGNLGLAYLRKGDHRRAVEALERSVTLQSSFCVGGYHLGEAYYHLNDFAHALQALDHALTTTARGCDQIQGAYLVRARVQIQLHHPDAVRADLARCVELDAHSAEGTECAALSGSVLPPAAASGTPPVTSGTPASPVRSVSSGTRADAGAAVLGAGP